MTMAAIKGFTSLNQSKELAKILPPESADQNWASIGIDIPCWSLAALLDVLPSGYEIVKNYHSLYFVESRDHGKSTNIFNNPVDACVEMIEKLHELNLL